MISPTSNFFFKKSITSEFPIQTKLLKKNETIIFFGKWVNLMCGYLAPQPKKINNEPKLI